MNAKEQLNKIKTLLGLQVKFEQAKLVDGAVVEAEAFEPEYSISIIANDEKVPMPVGAYETEDGKIITVEQEGIIAKVEDKPAEVEEVEAKEEEEVKAEAEAEPVQAKRIVESVSKETFFAAIDELKKEIETLRQEKESVKAELSEQVAEPIVHNPENVKKVEVQKYGKSSGIRENIYKQLFN